MEVRLLHLSPLVRAELQQLLASPEDVRTNVIRQLYVREQLRPIAETLIEFEEDEIARVELTRTLERLHRPREYFLY